MGRGVEGVMKVTLFNDCAGCGLSMRAKPHVCLTEMLLILSKKNYFRPDYSRASP